MFPSKRRDKAERKILEAKVSLERARVAREDQERKLEQEKESVVARIDRIARHDRLAGIIARHLAEGGK